MNTHFCFIAIMSIFFYFLLKVIYWASIITMYILKNWKNVSHNFPPEKSIFSLSFLVLHSVYYKYLNIYIHRIFKNSTYSLDIKIIKNFPNCHSTIMIIIYSGYIAFYWHCFYCLTNIVNAIMKLFFRGGNNFLSPIKFDFSV